MSTPDVENLSIAPGEGPFRVKGSGYKGHLDYVERFVPGGVAAMLTGFKDPRQADFFRQPFMASSLYDIFPLIAAGHVCARQANLSFAQFVRVRSRFQAERDTEGLYRALLKLATPKMAVSRLPAAQAQYLDLRGETAVDSVEDGAAKLHRQKLPVIVSRWFSYVFETYIEVVLKASGAKTVVVRSFMDERDQPNQGYESVRYRCEALWT